MLVVVDELWDAAEIVLLCQVKQALWGGADVIMSAASNSVPVEIIGRKSRFNRQVFICTGSYHVCMTRYCHVCTGVQYSTVQS